jgi:hypothetical protein
LIQEFLWNIIFFDSRLFLKFEILEFDSIQFNFAPKISIFNWILNIFLNFNSILKCHLQIRIWLNLYSIQLNWNKFNLMDLNSILWNSKSIDLNLNYIQFELVPINLWFNSKQFKYDSIEFELYWTKCRFYSMYLNWMQWIWMWLHWLWICKLNSNFKLWF